MNDAEKYYEMAQEQLKRQLDNIDVLNTKVNTMLVVTGVLLAILTDAVFNGRIFLLPSQLLIFLSVIILMRAYQIRDWHQGPNIKLVAHCTKYNQGIETFDKEAVDGIENCFNENEGPLDKKVDRLNSASRILFLGIIFTLAGSLLTLFQWPIKHWLLRLLGLFA